MPAHLSTRHLALWLLGFCGCTPNPQRLGLDGGNGDVKSGEAGDETADADEWGEVGLLDGACTVTRYVELSLELFDAPAPPRVEVFGDRFALVASDSVIQDRVADVAVASWQGVDVTEHFVLSGLCPDDRCRNLHGSAVLATDDGHAEFLLAEQGSSLSMAEYPLRLLAWRGGSAEAAISPLFDSRVNAITTRSDMKASRNAARALFASGNTDGSPLRVIEIAPGAAIVRAATPLEPVPIPWDCLDLIPTEEAGAISVISRRDGGRETEWKLWELDAAGNTVLDTGAMVPVGNELGYTNCPRVIESSEGFHAQWVNTEHASVIATISRGVVPGAAPALVDVSANPGNLAGALDGEFLFEATLDDGQRSLVRLTRDDPGSGTPAELPLLSGSSSEPVLAPPRVLRAAGQSLQVTYEFETTRVIEELHCK